MPKRHLDRVLSCRVKPQVRERLERLARHYAMTNSACLNRMLEEWLPSMDAKLPPREQTRVTGDIHA
jgi:hypothetical protein